MPPKEQAERQYHPQERVFVEHPQESWVPGMVNSVEETVDRAHGTRSHKYHCTVFGNTNLKVPNETDLVVAETKVHSTVPDESELGEVDDLLQLTYLHESTLLHSVRQRYFKSVIYTKIGPIVLALNPFDYTIPHYQEAESEKYMALGFSALSGGDKLLPHSWTIAHQAYWLMKSFGKNQSVIVSGESGAGKTEAAKIVAKYLGKVSHREAPPGSVASPVPTKVNQSSPILEAFGNAKTKRNDNSSRFGKFMKIHFANSQSGIMTGAEIEVYLLEKSRVVFHSEGERSYHSFYQAVAKDAGIAAANINNNNNFAHRDMFLREAMNNPEKIEGVDDLLEYEGVREAMGIVGIPQEDQDDSWRVCAGVLHALNIQFKPSDDGESSVVDHLKSGQSLRRAADLWGVPAEKLEEEFLKTVLTVAGEKVVRMHRVERARDVRDALCKALYEKLFLELVNIVNKSVGAPENPENWIGLLDIFGFEHFKRNSFEQLCINLANETLQGHYNQIIFKRDMEECVEEGINTESVVFQDNQPCIDLLRGKISILSLLDEECSLGKGTDVSFSQNISGKFKAHPNFITVKTDPTLFGIRHYAGDVTYDVSGFREKNMDTMKDALKQLIHDSSRSFVGKLLAVEEEKIAKLKTVSAVFRQQLNSLMNVLYSTNPHWIRCVKPHPDKKPRMFSGSEVMSQLACAGVLETVRIRKMSFSVRFTFADFWKHYRIVVDGRMVEEAKSASNRILSMMGFLESQAQIGKTKVFLKSEAFQKVSREKENRRKKALLAVSAALRAFASTKITAFRSHLKYVNDIQAFARLHQSLLAKRTAQYESDKRATIAWLKQLRACEKDEIEQRNNLGKEEKKALAEAEDGAKDLLTVVYRMMFEKHCENIFDAEEKGRKLIKEECYVGAAGLESSCVILAAEMSGRQIILKNQDELFCENSDKSIQLRADHRKWLLAVMEEKMNQVISDEDSWRQRILLEENGDSIYFFAVHRLAVQEKQGRRVVFMRAKAENRTIQNQMTQEHLGLIQAYEFGNRNEFLGDEQNLRISMMLESDRQEEKIQKMLIEKAKEEYLQKLELQGAMKKRYIMRR